MIDAPYREFSEDIEIEVAPLFLPEKSDPIKNIYLFFYVIRITNHRKSKVQLIKRKWFIRSGDGFEQVVMGDGVVGQTPFIEPGESFSYSSYCPLGTPTGNMRGQYIFLDVNENTFNGTIPLFFLRSANHKDHQKETFEWIRNEILPEHMASLQL